jgi:hypothetical protein
VWIFPNDSMTVHAKEYYGGVSYDYGAVVGSGDRHGFSLARTLKVRCCQFAGM